MHFEPFAFTKTWTDPAAFPTYETDERQVRADLQCLHDELRDGLNRLIAALNSADAAASLPFRPEEGLAADNVQSAITEVYSQIRRAAAGLLVDGSVTTEKLAQELLDRIYGGRLWVSTEEPDGTCTPDAGFPVGQLWLRPEWSLQNFSGSWLCDHGAAEAETDGWSLIPDEEGLADAVQSLAQIGPAGSRALIFLQAPEPDARLSALTLYLNGVEYNLLEEGGLFETVLDQTGSLELQVEALWPYAADGLSTALSHTAVILPDLLQQSLPGCRMPRDWAAFLEAQLPFSRLSDDWGLYLQHQAGQWLPLLTPVLPADRGGTGMARITAGALVTGGSGTDALSTVEPPAEAGSFLQYDAGPQWKTKAQTAAALEIPRIAAGSYTGTGAARTLTLPFVPVFLLLYPKGSCKVEYGGGYSDYNWDHPIPLSPGGSTMMAWKKSTDTGTSTYFPGVRLSGSQVEFFCNDGAAALANVSGSAYGWVAIGYAADG